MEKIARLQSQLERVEEDMVRTRKDADAKIERVRASGIEDRKQIGEYFKSERERCIAYMEKHCRLTFLFLLSSFKPVAFSLSRSSRSKTPKQVFF